MSIVETKVARHDEDAMTASPRLMALGSSCRFDNEANFGARRAPLQKQLQPDALAAVYDRRFNCKVLLVTAH